MAIESTGGIGNILPGEYIELVVKDTGTGITEENLKKIFDPFFTTKEGSKGTGLGLSIVKHIVLLHRGSISFDSQLGKGSRFVVRLPVN